MKIDYKVQRFFLLCFSLSITIIGIITELPIYYICALMACLVVGVFDIRELFKKYLIGDLTEQ